MTVKSITVYMTYTSSRERYAAVAMRRMGLHVAYILVIKPIFVDKRQLIHYYTKLLEGDTSVRAYTLAIRELE